MLSSCKDWYDQVICCQFNVQPGQRYGQNCGFSFRKMSRPRPPSATFAGAHIPNWQIIAGCSTLWHLREKRPRHLGLAAWTTGFQLVFPGFQLETNDQTLGKGRRSFQKFPGGSKRIVLSRYQIRCVMCWYRFRRKSLASSKYAIVDLEGFCNVGIHTPLVSSTLCINCICSDARNDARLHPCKMLQFTSHVFVIQSLNSYSISYPLVN